MKQTCKVLDIELIQVQREATALLWCAQHTTVVTDENKRRAPPVCLGGIQIKLILALLPTLAHT